MKKKLVVTGGECLLTETQAVSERRMMDRYSPTNIMRRQIYILLLFIAYSQRQRRMVQNFHAVTICGTVFLHPKKPLLLSILGRLPFVQHAKLVVQ
jgi:hypothetical protein